MKKNYHFSGWATRNNIRCSDGRTIMPDAFKHYDGRQVPLVWNHQHNDPLNILGHAKLENRSQGVYAYCTFNDTEAGQNARMLVEHGDVSSLSIYANRLKQNGGNVEHGELREVSLVLAGANPGAYIESIIRHGEEAVDEMIYYTGEEIAISHGSVEEKEEDDTDMKQGEKTIKDIFETLNEEQKTAVYAMIGFAMDEAREEEEDDEDYEEDDVKHNVFDTYGDEGYGYDGDVLTHSEMEEIIADGKRYGSLKDSFIAHGIEHIDYLFPEAKNFTGSPIFKSRDMGWVAGVMSGVHKSPFSRIRSLVADITEDDARAKGYIKGKMKKDEVFTLLKRSTSPTTIYKKQKIDRDDQVDITDFDVIAWLKGEMRMMLDEEIARAILVGDGRQSSSDDKVKEDCIRPIWKDEDLYTIKAPVELKADATSNETAKAFIRAVIKSRKEYKGSGEPTLYTTEDVITDLLLLEDTTGRMIYDSVSKLATVLRVKDIVAVPVMENQKRNDEDNKERTLMGVIVNLSDYNIGADKGGEVNMFDDFDIDFNQQKYLIETRCSGALVKPFSAVAIERMIPSAG